MALNQIIIYIMVLFMAIAAVDRIVDSPLGLGEKSFMHSHGGDDCAFAFDWQNSDTYRNTAVSLSPCRSCHGGNVHTRM